VGSSAIDQGFTDFTPILFEHMEDPTIDEEVKQHV